MKIVNKKILLAFGLVIFAQKYIVGMENRLINIKFQINEKILNNCSQIIINKRRDESAKKAFFSFFGKNFIASFHEGVCYKFFVDKLAYVDKITEKEKAEIEGAVKYLNETLFSKYFRSNLILNDFLNNNKGKGVKITINLN